MNWQPIETAPKDGTPVFVCVADNSMHCFARYKESSGCGWLWYREGSFDAVDATHWMSQPNGPNAPQGEAVAWQMRATFLGGHWTGWCQAQSQAEAEALVERYKQAGQQAEWRALCLACDHGDSLQPMPAAKAALLALSDDDRVTVLSQFCRSCGTHSFDCQCWNDE